MRNGVRYNAENLLVNDGDEHQPVNGSAGLPPSPSSGPLRVAFRDHGDYVVRSQPGDSIDAKNTNENDGVRCGCLGSMSTTQLISVMRVKFELGGRRGVEESCADIRLLL
ncbi:hypothetical protein MCOR06_011682 [Pyricularia oryzae]|nr:hypothetical protein MCOR06_011682 [Pyricularia oryzae]